MRRHSNFSLAHPSPQLDSELLKTLTAVIISAAKLCIWVSIHIREMYAMNELKDHTCERTLKMEDLAEI